MVARKQKKIPSSPSSVRSLGTGTMERMSSKASNSAILSTINDHDGHDHDNGQHESFVVRFRDFTSSWRQDPSTTTTTTATTANAKTLKALSTTSSSGSISDDEDEKEDDGNIIFDTTTDLSYHNVLELEGSKLILQALTPNEQSAIPDEFMPLRHYRAEKVRTFITPFIPPFIERATLSLSLEFRFLLFILYSL
jgi:hypothetical protein